LDEQIQTLSKRQPPAEFTGISARMSRDGENKMALPLSEVHNLQPQQQRSTENQKTLQYCIAKLEEENEKLYQELDEAYARNDTQQRKLTEQEKHIEERDKLLITVSQLDHKCTKLKKKLVDQETLQKSMQEKIDELNKEIEKKNTTIKLLMRAKNTGSLSRKVKSRPKSHKADSPKRHTINFDEMSGKLSTKRINSTSQLVNPIPRNRNQDLDLASITESLDLAQCI